MFKSYVTAGAVAGETAGVLLNQPGSGNSVALCGPAGGLARTALRDVHGFAPLAGIIVGWILRGTYPSTSRRMKPA